MSTEALSAILPLARSDNWRLFPVRQAEKVPLISDWPVRASSDEGQLRAWDDQHPACNWGMACGPESHVFVLDVDGDQGAAWYADQCRIRGEEWTQTRKAKTAKGFHLYYAWPDGVDIRNSAGKLAPGIDVRGTGGFVCVPGSVHPTGFVYAWMSAPDAPLLDAPAWLLTLVASASRTETVAAPAFDDIADVIPQGQRNNILASIAGAARRRGTSQEGIEALLLAENRRCSPRLDAAEVKKIAESISTYPPEPSADVQLLRAEGGAPRACVANVVALLRHSPEWTDVIAYDEFAERVVLRKPGPGFPSDARSYPRQWTDEADIYAQEWLQRAGILVNSANVVASAVQAVARESGYHPVRDYLANLVWDGVERADHWLEVCFGVDESSFTSAVSRRWLIGACARVFIPGCQVDHTLLLLGRQGIGKSSGLRALVPRDEWFADSVSTLGSRDSRQEMCGKWIIELSELSSLRRAEVESIKAFLSQRIDHYRPPYGRHAIDIPRSNVFAASTNEMTPLLDTANRRFWPVRVGKVDVGATEKNRDMLWAEAYAAFKRGELWHLDSAELQHAAEEAQKQAYQCGPWDETISEWVENPRRRYGVEWEATPWADSENGRINIGDVLGHCIGLEFSKWEQSGGAAAKSVGRCLRHLGYRMVQAGSGPHRGKRYYVKGETE